MNLGNIRASMAGEDGQKRKVAWDRVYEGINEILIASPLNHACPHSTSRVRIVLVSYFGNVSDYHRTKTSDTIQDTMFKCQGTNWKDIHSRPANFGEKMTIDKSPFP
ncbi:uncharacterized protein MELLADRAFT_106794 [Melampsora larici-populina 98AG31]|uniref:Uncharacterized protein n=1 Tax=Melampsora larici-populina (strain 98AG31 / pathotype 3-4-7) TaxID=747676 RepID=F4RMN5_MELLP|nr:uncharacterized protein MELLADRAFT_106794 [Melampsora larici-populina 98AG31]EGG06144.1 hypothetical protein MELLADRAFT_106794 [Melampsora larici-populina 98AG31]